MEKRITLAHVALESELTQLVQTSADISARRAEELREMIEKVEKKSDVHGDTVQKLQYLEGAVEEGRTLLDRVNEEAKENFNNLQKTVTAQADEIEKTKEGQEAVGDRVDSLEGRMRDMEQGFAKLTDETQRRDAARDADSILRTSEGSARLRALQEQVYGTPQGERDAAEAKVKDWQKSAEKGQGDTAGLVTPSRLPLQFVWGDSAGLVTPFRLPPEGHGTCYRCIDEK